MLIWGARAVRKTIDHGEFHCPTCMSTMPYERVRAQRHGHIYWIPLFSMGEAVEYVECGSCRGTFDPAVLTTAEEARASFHANYVDGMLAVMAAIAVADGTVDTSERTMIEDVFQRLAGQPLPSDLLDGALQEAEQGSHRLESTLRALEPFLNAEGKELVIRASLAIAAADGHLDESEGRTIAGIANALGMTRTHLSGLIAEFAAPQPGAS